MTLSSGDGQKVFGEFVRLRRRELRLTQQELADLAGVSTRTVHEIEHDKPTIRLDVLHQVLDVLGLDIAVSVRRV